MSDADRGPFVRFPWVQLAFCIACLAMACYTWMRYSYCWELDPKDASFVPSSYGDWPADAYVVTEYGLRARLKVRLTLRGLFDPEVSSDRRFSLQTVPAASRFTGESIAGLAVGAMGCLVFGLYLRAWLGARSRGGARRDSGL